MLRAVEITGNEKTHHTVSARARERETDRQTDRHTHIERARAGQSKQDKTYRAKGWGGGSGREWETERGVSERVFGLPQDNMQRMFRNQLASFYHT